MEKLAVLIPTRNRPQKLRVLLDSISRSTLRPHQLIIVASGDDIRSVLIEFEEKLNITYLHTQIAGQIAQKKLGVKLIQKDICWCLFIDDDLVIAEKALEIAVTTANSYPKRNVLGIGLSLPPTSRTLDLSRDTQRLANWFKLSSQEPGKVLTSGHATSYVHADSVIETQWLNGASIWRVELLGNYGINLPSTSYAACEDLIFSYSMSKLGLLIFVPQAKIYFQDSELTPFDSFKTFQSASLWRFYFVAKNRELSVRHFFLAQILRSAYAIYSSKSSRLKLGKDLFSLNLKIFFSYLARRPPERLLDKL